MTDSGGSDLMRRTQRDVLRRSEHRRLCPTTLYKASWFRSLSVEPQFLALKHW